MGMVDRRVLRAAEGFAVVARDYERSRPSYPLAAIELVVDRLGVRPGARACDLGAGTGKLTRMLVAEGLSVVAVEPSPAMRAVLESEITSIPTANTDRASTLSDAGFVDISMTRIEWTEHATRESLAARVRSSSSVAMEPEPVQQTLVDQVLARHAIRHEHPLLPARRVDSLQLPPSGPSQATRPVSSERSIAFELLLIASKSVRER
jgi:hypothetical protein